MRFVICFVLMPLFNVGFSQRDSLAFEKVMDHPLYELKGYSTFRLYYYPSDSSQVVTMIWGDTLHPAIVFAEGGFWQSPYGGCFSTDMNPALLEYEPELFYDSWLALGADRALPGVEKPSKAENPWDTWSQRFEAGGPLHLRGTVGGAWFSVKGVPCNGNKLLLGQFTVKGRLSARLNIQLKQRNTGEKQSVIGLFAETESVP